MIKRFASHFIFLPGHGYLKQYVVGVEEGQVVSAFPLTEEIEGVEWFPGVIALLNNEEDISKGYSGIFQKANEGEYSVVSHGQCLPWWLEPSLDYIHPRCSGNRRYALFQTSLPDE